MSVLHTQLTLTSRRLADLDYESGCAFKFAACRCLYIHLPLLRRTFLRGHIPLPRTAVSKYAAGCSSRCGPSALRGGPVYGVVVYLGADVKSHRRAVLILERIVHIRDVGVCGVQPVVEVLVGGGRRKAPAQGAQVERQHVFCVVPAASHAAGAGGQPRGGVQVTPVAHHVGVGIRAHVRVAPGLVERERGVVFFRRGGAEAAVLQQALRSGVQHPEQRVVRGRRGVHLADLARVAKLGEEVLPRLLFFGLRRQARDRPPLRVCVPLEQVHPVGGALRHVLKALGLFQHFVRAPHQFGGVRGASASPARIHLLGGGGAGGVSHAPQVLEQQQVRGADQRLTQPTAELHVPLPSNQNVHRPVRLSVEARVHVGQRAGVEAGLDGAATRQTPAHVRLSDDRVRPRHVGLAVEVPGRAKKAVRVGDPAVLLRVCHHREASPAALLDVVA
mmetsp:Transcript_53273/g.106869  ORF Transcript_53273/g.106869 Transcript_53273/m.106869 type:complete len:446 (+) Transcript_53273:123-1460(+)